ncbi:MAG: APC family permease, partial [Duncaniella sp.]|nr:APC family permease [Duncaniella sp.]
SKGILAVGQAGYLPKFFQKTNKNGVQKNILYLQGIVVTVLALLMVVMPSVESFYQILSQLTCILYLIAYLLMFASAIRLRYNMKDAPRPYRLGKSGNGVMWLIAGVGVIGSLLAFIFSFFPPSQIEMGSNAVWFSVLIFGTILFVVLPFIILAFKKKSWNSMGTDFVPFHWDNTPGAAQLRQKAAEEFAAENGEDTPEHAQALLSHASSINRMATSDSKADVKQ